MDSPRNWSKKIYIQDESTNPWYKAVYTSSLDNTQFIGYFTDVV